MNISHVFTNLAKTAKRNSPEILTALGVSGLITTAYLTAKGSFRACRIIDANEREGGTASDPKERIKERTKLVWKEYIPAGIAGGLTIVCVVGSSKASKARTAAAVTAYSITERAFSQYRDKVVEQMGAGKEQKIRDDIVQERITNNPPPTKDVIVIGNGYVLCCELFTGRYFRSNMETLKQAEIEIRKRITQDAYVPLDEFYELIGLPYTSNSNHIGWDSDKLMELEFTTAMGVGGEPCLAFEYNYTKPIR